jgi:hypothetical protein
VVDPSATKVNAIAILKVMQADKMHGQRATMALEKDPRWERYKYQRHDLFVTKNEKVDYFLADSRCVGCRACTHARMHARARGSCSRFSLLLLPCLRASVGCSLQL